MGTRSPTHRVRARTSVRSIRFIAHCDPHYLLILGSIDVVPHQDPKNPVFVDDQEDDPVAWGDLPYACDAPYSRDIAKFIGPDSSDWTLAGYVGSEATRRTCSRVSTWRQPTSRGRLRSI